MKVILVYSGKGGVGKTTTTAFLACNFLKENKKVCIIDGDLNTPSMPVIFPNNEYKNLLVLSTGYSLTKGFYLSELSRNIIKKMIREAKKFNPDYILIDTPPSITEIHEIIKQYINISGVIIVTENSELSFNDVRRTISLFAVRDEIPTLGIVLSKIDKNEDLNIPGELKFIKVVGKFYYDLSVKKLIESGNLINEFVEIEFDLPAIDAVEWKVFKNNRLIFDNISKDDLCQIIKEPSHFKFYNLETWEYIREELLERIETGGSLFCDAFLDYNNTETIKRLLDGFEDENETLITILRNPNVGINIFPGEMGRGRLLLNEKYYYSVPRVAYQTDEGEVILFPHECCPAGKNVEQLIEDNELVRHPKSNTYRLIPERSVFIGLFNAFGNLMGITEGIIDRYEKLFD